MTLSAEEIERRKPLWEAMSELYLDTETRWSLPYVAWAMLRSGYDDETLERIWRDEVAPTFCGNMVVLPGGVWTAFAIEGETLDELVARASLSPPTSLRTVRYRAIEVFGVHGQWLAVKRLFRILREVPPERRRERVNRWDSLARVYLEAVDEPYRRRGASRIAHWLALRKSRLTADTLPGASSITALGAPADDLLAILRDEILPIYRPVLIGREKRHHHRAAKVLEEVVRRSGTAAGG